MTGKIIDFGEMLQRKQDAETKEMENQVMWLTYGELLDCVEDTTLAWLEFQVSRSDSDWLELKQQIIDELEIRKNANTDL